MNSIRLFRIFENIYHFLMLFILTGALIPLLLKANGSTIDPYAGDPLIQTILIIGYCLMLPYLYIYRMQLFRSIQATFWVWILVTLAFLSCFWSSVPFITLRKSASLFLIMVYGLILVLRFSTYEYFLLLGKVLLTILLLSLAFVILLPNLGIMHDQGLSGSWCGIFTHKHFLGFICNLSLILFLYLFRKSPGKTKTIWLAGIALALILTIGSRSMEGLIGEIIILFSLPILSLLQQGKWTIPLGISFLLGFGFFLLLNSKEVLSLLGKSQTLTGRTPLWEASLIAGLQKPWLGYGYKAFWLGKDQAFLSLVENLGMNLGHAHNGYIDLFLDLGFVGVILGLIIFGGAILKIVRTMTLTHKFSPEIQTFFLLCLNLLVLNLVENHMFEPNQIATMFFIQLNYLGFVELHSVILNRRHSCISATPNPS